MTEYELHEYLSENLSISIEIVDLNNPWHTPRVVVQLKLEGDVISKAECNMPL